MAEIRGELDLYNQWFSIADQDKDGVLSGPEAVQFFLRSGLPQNPTLFKVWQYVAGDRPALARQEFYTAMKLVSLAQSNNGVLDDAQAMRLVNGLGGPIQPPAMQGLAIPKGIDVPTTAAAAPARAPPLAPAASARPGYPGAGPAAAVLAAPGALVYPPLTAEQANAFQAAFTQLDADRDGYVTGVDCFGAFMQSGLPKEILKTVWDLVAGDAGQLSRHQFVQALYMIECVKRGIPLPPRVPPGQFPPVAGTVNISSMMGTPQDIYQSSLAVPPLMPRAVYQAPAKAPAVGSFPSQVPTFEAGRIAALDASERLRIESEREAALKQEAERKKAEEERAASQAKRDFFTASLAELRLAQSKVTRAVVEAQQRCEMERVEAERMEADYNRAYAEFSVKHAQNAPLVEALKKVQEEKAALAAKLDSLRAMVEQLESVDPQWEQRERGECEALNQEIAALTVRREELQAVADAVERQRGELSGHIEALKAVAAAVDGQVAPLREQVDKMAAEAGKEGDVVVALLRQLAPLYNKLYDAAKQAMVPLPAEALATIKREPAAFKYDELLVAGAESWGDFKDDGFKIVSALPADTRLTTFTSPALAAAAAEEGVGEESEEHQEDLAEAVPAAADAAASTAAASAVDVVAREDSAGADADGAVTAAPAGAPAGAQAEQVVDGASPAKTSSAGGSPAAAAAVPVGSRGPSRGPSDAAAQADGEALTTPLGKRASLAAEEEAVQAAAEAGVLASAIAEALTGSRPGSKAGSLPPSKQGSSLAEQFAVTFDGPAAAGAPVLETKSPAAAPAALDAFAEGFGSLALDSPSAQEAPRAAASSIQLPAENGGVPKSPAAAPMPASGGEEVVVKSQVHSTTAAAAAPAASDEGWTAF